MATPHVMALPYPAQGHVIPMLELSQWLATRGVKVTFVNSHFNHRRVVESSPGIGEMVSMVCVSDGLEKWEDRNDLEKQSEGMLRVMVAEVDALITKINGDGGPKITCVIADWVMAWAVGDVTARFGLRTAIFCPASAATLALSVAIPKLVADGVIDDKDGQPLSKNQTIQLSPSMPPINSGDFLWACIGNKIIEENVFYMLSNGHNSITSSDWILCNSSHDLEPGIFSSFPHFNPIGPLLATNRLSKSAGGFWAADSTCLTWLHQHPPNSVVYAAFGSTTILDTTQFHELALGLELAGRPFLWVVRQNLTGAAAGEEFFPAGFKERVGQRGLVVEWAPQQEVLAHPSVACFMSHCGWNSTVEGVSNGVPFLCWPYFAEQFCNRDYVCNEWRIGLRLEKDENGMVTREEVKGKVESLVGDGGFKERALNLGARVMDSVQRGGSYSNFTNFVDWIKNLNTM